MRAATAICYPILALAPASPAVAEIDIAEGKGHWAYQPLQRVATPAVEDLGWPRDLIDHHLLAAMEARGLRPAADADRRTLIRRATYDLTGLPPTPGEIDDFLADTSPYAFARVVDRLLASPAYGERWGRHWLDVVRYADTSGSSSDHPVPEVHRYRDYVIAAFNEDKPYDQFVREQIAGDLLDAADGTGRGERTIATGYLAGARRFGVSGEEVRLTVEDTIINLGEAFLATSIGCARCHDHTHDPIPITDYYAIYGIFASTHYPFPGSETQKIPLGLVPLSGDPAEKRALEVEFEQLNAEFGELKRGEAGTAGAGGDRMGEITARLREVRLKLATLPDLAYAVAEGRKVGDAFIQDGKRAGPEGGTIRRGFLQVLGGQQLPPDHPGSGRLELAGWVASEANPLFARVIVNRIWAWHFGRGLVETPNDFGTHGSPPSHPGLLDHLARQFVADGYSFKTMHRRVMLSRAYGLSSDGPARYGGIDPDATYRWRFQRRRLSSEEIRDSMLAAAGQLDRSPGGAHPFPPKAEWKYTQHLPFYAEYDHDRRSVYLMQQRLRKHPVLATFDGADTNSSTPLREQSAGPVQALFLMNAPFAHRSAAGLAERIATAGLDDAGRIGAAHRITFGREALEEDIKLGQSFLADYRRALAGAVEDPLEIEAKVLIGYARALLSSNEFIYID